MNLEAIANDFSIINRKILKFTFDPKTQTGTLNRMEFQYRGNRLEFFHNGTDLHKWLVAPVKPENPWYCQSSEFRRGDPRF
jgi:hypothetical protein